MQIFYKDQKREKIKKTQMIAILYYNNKKLFKSNI